MISRNIEIYSPYVLAVIGAAGVYLFASCIPTIPKSLAAGTMTFGAVVAGFTATQRNMLLSMKASKVLTFLAKLGHDKSILRCLAECVYGGLLVTVISVVRFFIVTDASWWLALWSGSLIFIVWAMARNEAIMFLAIKRWMEEN